MNIDNLKLWRCYYDSHVSFRDSMYTFCDTNRHSSVVEVWLLVHHQDCTGNCSHLAYRQISCNCRSNNLWRIFDNNSLVLMHLHSRRCTYLRRETI